MTEKENILASICCNGDSIVEACEGANTKLLREQGENELAATIDRLLAEVGQFSDLVGLSDDELCDAIIAKCEAEDEEMDQ